MRILVVGESTQSIKFYNKFSEQEENIVFTTAKDQINCIEFTDIVDISDFCEANEIDLVLIVDEKYINSGLQELITQKNITAFSPSSEAVVICSSKTSAKKFMHRNKIRTPKFEIAQNSKIAMDFIKANPMPFAIKPDYKSYSECVVFCETYKSAQSAVNKFFDNGNKKIVVEDYIQGKNITSWILTDGYSAHIIGSCANYRDEISFFEPDFLTQDIKKDLYDNFIMPTIQALADEDSEYIGILGFDYIIDNNNEIYLLGYKSFFDDLNVDFFLNGYNVDWTKIFESTIIGDVFIKYDIKPEDGYMVTVRQNENVDFVSAVTKSNIKRYLKELDYNLKEFCEAEKLWKS